VPPSDPLERGAPTRYSTDEPPARALAPPCRARASWVFGVAAVLAVNVVAWFGLVRTDVETLRPSVRRVAAFAWSPAAEVRPIRAPRPGDEPLPGANAAAAPAIAAPSIAPTASAVRPSRAAASARSPVGVHPVDLHSNPYVPH
jgi:hypothetical protein